MLNPERWDFECLSIADGYSNRRSRNDSSKDSRSNSVAANKPRHKMEKRTRAHTHTQTNHRDQKPPCCDAMLPWDDYNLTQFYELQTMIQELSNARVKSENACLCSMSLIVVTQSTQIWLKGSQGWFVVLLAGVHWPFQWHQIMYSGCLWLKQPFYTLPRQTLGEIYQ